MNPAITGAVTALPYVLWAAVCAFGIVGCAWLLVRPVVRPVVRRIRAAVARHWADGDRL